MKLVLSRSQSEIAVYQYPEFAFNVENHLATPYESKQSSMLGIRYVFWIVIVLNRRYSIQNRQNLSDYSISTRIELHLRLGGSIAAWFNITSAFPCIEALAVGLERYSRSAHA